MPVITSFIAGLLFALGLGIGGMTDPGNVQSFLDVAGDWDPRLAFVMAGAVGTHGILRLLLVRRRPKPLLAAAFPDLSPQPIDRRLLIGSALFGIGWGLVGYCPGPALVAVPTATGGAVLFTLAMLGGMKLHALWVDRIDGRVSGKTAQETVGSQLP